VKNNLKPKENMIWHLDEKKVGEKFWSGAKKSRKSFGRVQKSRGKIWSGKIF